MDEISRVLVTAGGKIRAGRCLARSKRTGDQCGAPAEKGKQVCRFHGGRSTGPRTELGKEKIRAALRSHGGGWRRSFSAIPREPVLPAAAGL
jgi:hypothetical protein